MKTVTTVELIVAFLFFFETRARYTFESIMHSASGISAFLRLTDHGRYSNDIQRLSLLLDNINHMKLTDADNPRWEVSEEYVFFPVALSYTFP